MNRRTFLETAAAALPAEAAAQDRGAVNDAPIRPRDPLKITRLETFLVKPRWLFLKVHTNAGITGLGEPITEGRTETCSAALREIEPYLVGKDPRQIVGLAAGALLSIFRSALAPPVITSDSRFCRPGNPGTALRVSVPMAELNEN